MHCLVLGAGGFIGGHLVQRLLRDGCKVTAYSRSNQVAQTLGLHPRLDFVRGDFTTEERWNQMFKGVDVCYHLISTTVPKSSNDAPIADVSGNIIGTLRLMEAAKHHNARIVFASSGGTVYGAIKSPLITEEHATNPVCSYGITKLAIEKYLQLYRDLHGLRSIVLRAANPYGAGQRADSIQGAVAVFMGRMMQGKPINLWGDGSVVRDYVYIDDLVEAFVKVGTYTGPHMIFNIGSGTGTSLLELVQTIETVSDIRASILFHPPRGFDVPRNVLDISRAAQALGWTPTVNLRDGLERTAEWMHTRGDGVEFSRVPVVTE